MLCGSCLATVPLVAFFAGVVVNSVVGVVARIDRVPLKFLPPLVLAPLRLTSDPP